MKKASHSKILKLKPISLEYVSAIFGAITGNVAEYFYNFKNLEETRTWVEKAIIEHGNGKKLEYVLFDDNEFIGMISPCYLTPDTVEIGLWIAPDKQGEGYGSQAFTELLSRLEKENVTNVIYETEPENVASVHLATSLGFRLSQKTDKMLTFKKNLN